jgi:hypothetical protein
MRSLDHLPPATQDRQALTTWLETHVAIQRKLAKLLLEHPDQSEHALREGIV